jgi:hypothetical protein
MSHLIGSPKTLESKRRDDQSTTCHLWLLRGDTLLLFARPQLMSVNLLDADAIQHQLFIMSLKPVETHHHASTPLLLSAMNIEDVNYFVRMWSELP